MSSRLQDAVNALAAMLEHAPGFGPGARIYLPTDDDDSPAAELKRRLMRGAEQVLDAGRERLRGVADASMPPLDRFDVDGVEQSLQGDGDQLEFRQLVSQSAT